MVVSREGWRRQEGFGCGEGNEEEVVVEEKASAAKAKATARLWQRWQEGEGNFWPH